jgi:hypothetical protein
LLTSNQIEKLSSKILPELSDDDYFIDIKNSVVFSYLMKSENDTNSKKDFVPSKIKEESRKLKKFKIDQKKNTSKKYLVF